jgi:hypothetical protein
MPGLRERAGTLRDDAGACRDGLRLAPSRPGLREYARSLETQLRACEAALRVCEEAGAERLGDVAGWPGKLRAALS